MARSLFKTAEPAATTAHRRETCSETATAPAATTATATVALQPRPQRRFSLRLLSQLSALVLVLGGAAFLLQPVPLGGTLPTPLAAFLAQTNLKLGRLEVASTFLNALPTEGPQELGEVDYTPLRTELIQKLTAAGAWSAAYEQAGRVAELAHTRIDAIFQEQVKKEGLVKALAILDQLPARLDSAHDNALRELGLKATSTRDLGQLIASARTAMVQDELRFHLVRLQLKSAPVDQVLATVQQIQEPNLRVAALRTLGIATTDPQVVRHVLTELNQQKRPEALFAVAALQQQTALAEKTLLEYQKLHPKQAESLVTGELYQKPTLLAHYQRLLGSKK